MPINPNNPPKVPLTSQQLAQLQAFETAGQYAEGYKYLKDIVTPPSGTGVGVPGTGALGSWLDKAASINGDDGTPVSNAVRGATKGAGDFNGDPISDSRFQDASDKLAKDVFRDIYDRGGIPPLEDIIQKDVQTAINELGLKPWQWAGTWGDDLPVPLGGLNHDYQTYPDNWSDFQKAYEGARTIGDGLREAIRDAWDRAKDFFRRSDPLTLDLDGDGLETTGAGIFNPIYFDHDGDGIKNGSGWVKPDDAFLVLDKNGNGTIDNGRELFGDSTIKSNGQLAKDGFVGQSSHMVLQRQ